jgi:hypothetical protein
LERRVHLTVGGRGAAHREAHVVAHTHVEEQRLLPVVSTK